MDAPAQGALTTALAICGDVRAFGHWWPIVARADRARGRSSGRRWALRTALARVGGSFTINSPTQGPRPGTTARRYTHRCSVDLRDRRAARRQDLEYLYDRPSARVADMVVEARDVLTQIIDGGSPTRRNRGRRVREHDAMAARPQPPHHVTQSLRNSGRFATSCPHGCMPARAPAGRGRRDRGPEGQLVLTRLRDRLQCVLQFARVGRLGQPRAGAIGTQAGRLAGR